MQGDVSVSPPNLDLMAALSNRSRSSDMKPAYSGAFKGIDVLTELSSLESSGVLGGQPGPTCCMQKLNKWKLKQSG